MKLIVIDDEQENLDLICAALEQLSLEIHTATDPQRGLELIRRLRPKVVLLDLVMPGVQGMEVLRQILDIDPGIDVILMTGYSFNYFQDQGSMPENTDVLYKPFLIETLREKLVRLMAK